MERLAERIHKEAQKLLSPYFALYQGEEVLLSEIEEKAPDCLPALEALINDGKVVGQSVLEKPGDLLLSMPSVKKKGESIPAAQAG